MPYETRRSSGLECRPTIAYGRLGGRRVGRHGARRPNVYRITDPASWTCMTWAHRWVTSLSQITVGRGSSGGPMMANVERRRLRVVACSSGNWLSAVTSTASGQSRAMRSRRSTSRRPLSPRCDRFKAGRPRLHSSPASRGRRFSSRISSRSTRQAASSSRTARNHSTASSISCLLRRYSVLRTRNPSGVSASSPTLAAAKRVPRTVGRPESRSGLTSMCVMSGRSRTTQPPRRRTSLTARRSS